MGRTNRLFCRRADGSTCRGPGRWARPRGAPARSSSSGPSRRGTEYELRVVRPLTSGALREAHARLVEVVADGEPALLYIGNGDAAATRHPRPAR